MMYEIFSWFKNQIDSMFIDHDSIKRFFRIEYGMDADLAYRHWLVNREFLNKIG